MKTQQQRGEVVSRGESRHRKGTSLWRRVVVCWALCMALWPVGAWAQQKKNLDEAGDTELLAVDPNKGKLQTEAPTLQNEAKSTDVIRAEEFAKARKFESLKKIDEQIQSIKKLIEITPQNHPDRPQFLFNLAELYFEKSKYYSLKAYETQDRCFKLEDKKAPAREVELCKQQMKDEEEESVRLRTDAVKQYTDIISNYTTFKNMDEVLYYLGSSLMELKKRDQALDIYKRLIANYPASQYVPNVLVAFGDAYFDGEDMAQAIKAYDKVTTSYQNSGIYGYALYKKGWCYFNLDEKEKALDHFLQTLKFVKKRQDLPNSKPLLKQVKKDIVTTYAFVGAASKAIPFFQKVTDNDREEWLEMGERLAVYYSDKGKFADSMALYRELIKLNQESVKVLDYQYEIVRNQTSQNTYSEETLKQIVLLIKLVQVAESGKFKDRDSAERDYKGSKAKIEELARTWAQTYHREAQQTKNPELYARAYYLYKEYLDSFANFTEKDELYRMTFFFAELLYKLEKYEDAATNYEKALAVNGKGEYTEEIVHSAVLAYFKLVSVDDSKKETNLNEINEKPQVGKDGKPVAYKPPTPRDIPDLQKRLIKACDRYMEFAPDGKKIVDVKYTRARIYYDFDHMAESAKGFKEIAWKHSDKELAVIAANLHLDALYVMRDLETMEKEVRAYLGEDMSGEKVGEPPIKDETFLEEVTEMAAAIAFKKCTVMDEKEEWAKASECFVAFFRKYPDSEYGDDALYNAALDLERISEIGKAIQVRFFLLKAYGDTSEHSPITLYNIAANYHALAIYSQAALFYERFVQFFPEHEKAEDALRNASTFRYGLGEYEKAIENYKRYLDLFGKAKPDQAAAVAYQIALSYEKQNKSKAAFQQYEEYLKRWAKYGSDDNRLQSHVKIGLYYWGLSGKSNRAKALSEFQRTLAEYEALSREAKEAAVKGRDAAAQARFMIGENIFEEMAAMQIDSPNEKELQKRLIKKREKGGEAAKMFEQVFSYGRPDWTIASFFRIGDAYENFANSLRGTRCPGRLSYDQCEIYKGLLEDMASQIEAGAIDFYIKALESSKAARWFNKYTKDAEVRLATLRPREYRKPSEFRAEPGYIQSGFVASTFITEVKDKDQLEDLSGGTGDE